MDIRTSVLSYDGDNLLNVCLAKILDLSDISDLNFRQTHLAQFGGHERHEAGLVNVHGEVSTTAQLGGSRTRHVALTSPQLLLRMQPSA